MKLSTADLDSIRAIVRAELERKVPKKRRRLPCGRGSSPPECWGSVHYGPDGCYCRDRE